MMMGATPATFTNSGCTTPSAMPAATPASIALPPASRILKPASAARYWVAAIMWCVPMMVGRWDFMLAPWHQGLVSLDAMKTQLARDRARDQRRSAPSSGLRLLRSSIQLQRRPAHRGVEQRRAHTADRVAFAEQAQRCLVIALDHHHVGERLAARGQSLAHALGEV